MFEVQNQSICIELVGRELSQMESHYVTSSSGTYLCTYHLTTFIFQYILHIPVVCECQIMCAFASCRASALYNWESGSAGLTLRSIFGTKLNFVQV